MRYIIDIVCVLLGVHNVNYILCTARSTQYYWAMTVMIVADSRAIDLMKIWQGSAINLPLDSFQTFLAFSHYCHQRVMVTAEMMMGDGSELGHFHIWVQTTTGKEKL